MNGAISNLKQCQDAKRSPLPEGGISRLHLEELEDDFGYAPEKHPYIAEFDEGPAGSGDPESILLTFLVLSRGQSTNFLSPAPLSFLCLHK